MFIPTFFNNDLCLHTTDFYTNLCMKITLGKVSGHRHVHIKKAKGDNGKKKTNIAIRGIMMVPIVVVEKS